MRWKKWGREASGVRQYENYKNTGSIYYKHNPDLCLDDVEKSLSKLKDRRDKYRDYKKKCENK